MTFIPVQEIGTDGTIKVFAKKEYELQTGSVTTDEHTGSVKAQAKVKVVTADLTDEDFIAFDSLEDAERFVLDEGEVFWGMGTPPLNNVEPEARLAHRLAMARANIANNSNRGFGSTFVTNAENVSACEAALTQMKKVKIPQPNAEGDVDLVDGERPYFENPEEIKIIAHEGVEEGKVLVLYQGTDAGDQPLIYVEGKGLAMNSKVSDVENYGKFIRIP